MESRDRVLTKVLTTKVLTPGAKICADAPTDNFPCVQPQNPDDAYGTRWAVTAYWSPVPEASAPGRWMPYLHPHDPITKSRMLEVCDWSDTVVIDPRLAVVISGVNSSQSGGL